MTVNLSFPSRNSKQRHGNQRGALPVCRRGAVVVEVALLAVLLSFIIVGIIETSRAAQVKEVLSNATRSACRLGTTYSGTNTGVINEVNSVLGEHGLKAQHAAITIKVNDAAGDVAAAVNRDKITVTVDYPASKVSLISSVFVSKNSTFSETIHMMKQ